MSTTVLIVDDEVEVARALSRLLVRNGFVVKTAASPAEGLEVVASMKPDIVVSDYRMPGMNGGAFLRQVGELVPGIRSYLLSGYMDLDEREDLSHVGGILRKPWDNAALLATLRAAVPAH